MERVLEVVIEDTDGAVIDATTHTDFPVRIGRDEGCELRLPFSFVSRRHARIERVGDGFALIPEKSRHGISHRGRRLEVGQSIELVDASRFEIDALVITVRLGELTQPMPFAESTHENATALYADQQVVPEVMEQYRAARVSALAAVLSALTMAPAARRCDVAGKLLAEHPEFATDADCVRILESFGVGPRSCSVEPSEEAQAALRGLQRLATAYVRSPPPSDAASIVSFLVCIDRTLRAFISAKVELDFVYGCETAEGGDRSEERTREVSHDLLDWKAGTSEAVARLESDFIRIVGHHASLVTDVEAAVAGIVRELSPTAIEWAAKGARWQGPFWARTLWRTFSQRHRKIVATMTERLGRRFCRVDAALRGTRSLPGEEPERSADEGPPFDTEVGVARVDTHWPFEREFAWEQCETFAPSEVV